jgi:hypothetical protein
MTKTQTSSARARLGFGDRFGPDTAVARRTHRRSDFRRGLIRFIGRPASEDPASIPRGCAMIDLRQLIARIAGGKVHPP